MTTSTRIRRVDCRGEGIARRGAGRGFTYQDADGQTIRDEDTLTRIRELAIPPAWKDVWICPDPLGHLQATGVDDAGRKQYLYHERWQRRQAQKKFDSMRDFAAALPRLRRAVTADLRPTDMPRTRALACAVRLLDLGFFRVGNEVYSEDNGSFGLTTVRREHVSVNGKEVVFDFPSKSGQRRVQSIRDPAACRAIATMYRRRTGPEDLLAWRDGKEWHDVDSTDVNEYIQSKIGREHSAKDFRTWHGTVLAAVALARMDEPTSEAAEKRAVRSAVEEVAAALGNTPAVARSSYIDPRVIERFRNGETIRLAVAASAPSTARARARLEREVRSLIS